MVMKFLIKFNYNIFLKFFIMNNMLSIETSLIEKEVQIKWWELWRTDLVRLATEYILKTPEKQIEFTNRPRLVQRVTINERRWVDYDYMWASEFETGIVWRTLAQLVEWKEKWELVFFSSDDWSIEWLSHISIVKEAMNQANWLLDEDKNGYKEYRLQEFLHSSRFSNFICLDNEYFFSTSGNSLKFLKYLDYISLRNNHTENIKTYPKFIEIDNLCKKVSTVLREKWISVTYIWINAGRIADDTLDEWAIKDSDFENCIWINSNTKEIKTWWFDEKDLLDALEFKWVLFTDAFWLREKNYTNVAESQNIGSLEKMIDIFIATFNCMVSWEEEYKQDLEQIIWEMDEIMKILVKNPALNRQIIDKLIMSPFFDYVIEKVDMIDYLTEFVLSIYSSDTVINKIIGIVSDLIWVEKAKNILGFTLNIRKDNIELLATKTIEDIKRLYSKWVYVSKFSGKLEKWYQPSQLGINFSNNLYRMWFETKELNVYVDPETYKKAYNEILIWDADHNWATVMVWKGNYEWITECLNMEKLTWIKQIRHWNIAYLNKIGSSTFNRYHWYWEPIHTILSAIKDLKWVDINTVFWIFSRLNDLDKWDRDEDKKRLLKIIKKEIWMKNIEKLRNFDITKVIYDVFRNAYLWELTDEKYKEFAIKLNVWLHEQIDKLLKFVDENKKWSKVNK